MKKNYIPLIFPAVLLSFLSFHVVLAQPVLKPSIGIIALPNDSARFATFNITMTLMALMSLPEYRKAIPSPTLSYIPSPAPHSTLLLN